MKKMYSSEKNVLMLISLMKKHEITKIVISPGSTNICLVASLQNDGNFELYSSADERSAAYIACGLSAESGEPVAISCTAATASRNYYPALTEAFYRKLPILAITSSRSSGQIGQNIDQVTDRLQLPNDIVRRSVQIPVIRTEDDEWECNVKINTALIELNRKAKGPVHINLITEYSTDFSVLELPETRVIRHYTYRQDLPCIPTGKIAIFVGAHMRWSDDLTSIVDLFCEKYNAIVFNLKTSNYRGKYGISIGMINQQKMSIFQSTVDLIIHIGNVAESSLIYCKQVWRVNPDGEVRDTFRKLTNVFEMEEKYFFEQYVKLATDRKDETSLYQHWKQRYTCLLNKALEREFEIPFSNAWIALQMHDKLPMGCVLHLGILNSVRCWNMFDIDSSILSYCNTGGFGIDGNTSSLIGASLAHINKLYFGIVGDLSFFYDINSLGNRHVGNNIRLLIVNNGIGTEFKNRMSFAQRAGIGDDADPYIAAAGHYGNKSRLLVRHYAEDLGYKYISAENKKEFLEKLGEFISPVIGDRSIVFEVFVESRDDTESLEILQTLDVSVAGSAKRVVADILGEKGVKIVKKMIGRK